jgi:hypothetical protein
MLNLLGVQGSGSAESRILYGRTIVLIPQSGRSTVVMASGRQAAPYAAFRRGANADLARLAPGATPLSANREYSRIVRPETLGSVDPAAALS